MIGLLANGLAPAARTTESIIDSVEIVEASALWFCAAPRNLGLGDETMFYCLIWRFQEGGWQFVHDMFTSAHCRRKLRGSWAARANVCWFPTDSNLCHSR